MNWITPGTVMGVLGLALLGSAAPMASPAWPQVEVFRAGDDDYHTFRIPSIIVAPNGTLLAFGEGRRRGSQDSGAIELVLKRSADGGRNWSPLQIVWEDGANTCGNPCPVVDRDTRTIWLLMTWNRGDDPEPRIIEGTSRDTRRVFVSRSADDGLTWSRPAEITAEVKLPTWTWFATGPGAGIQIERGRFRGRLVIPCDHIEAGTKHYYSHVIYSDDHGGTWRRGGSSPRDQVNECEVVELTGDRLLLNMRNYDRAQRARQVAVSRDGGLTWTDQRHVPELLDPICQASLRRHSWPGESGEGLLLFSNPASLKREKLTVRLSRDEGGSWPSGREVWSGPSAYSCLVVLPDKTVGCLYERGNRSPYEAIAFARFSVAWLAEGRIAAPKPGSVPVP